MATRNARTDRQHREGGAPIGPRARKAAAGRIKDARQLLDTTLAGIVDHLEGDTPWRDARTTFAGVVAAVAVARNAGAVNTLLEADGVQAPSPDDEATAKKKRKLALIEELASMEAEDDA